MPRVAVEHSFRMSLRIKPDDKAMLLRTVALKNTDLTNFVLRTVLHEAKTVIDEAEHIQISNRDSLKVLNLLENPPVPNKKLRTTALALKSRP